MMLSTELHTLENIRTQDHGPIPKAV